MSRLDLPCSFTLESFEKVVSRNLSLGLSEASLLRLQEVRRFVEHLLKENAVVYGLTTGFADLRSASVSPEKAAELSRNMLLSHDAGIGPLLPDDVVLGAMVLRANSLAQGYSGFQPSSLVTLVQMINANIIPEIPSCGSLGASGDLALLARLGRSMCGDEVPVLYQGQRMSAKEALLKAEILPFRPQAKEGLALTNGTSFMTSMAAIALIREIHLLENILALLPLFLESVEAVDAAFAAPLHSVRGQEGQTWVASLLDALLCNSSLINRQETQNDYCIRCIPQILGPKIELLFPAVSWVEQELNAVTDNPLIFKGSELCLDLVTSRQLHFQNETWAVLSGGNFHGEYLTTASDIILLLNAKIALLLERQMTYLLNPFRNKNTLPVYLIADPKSAGLCSGYMITQYTGNDLAQRIAALGTPTGIYNLTSANESEDVVSYGSAACQKLLSQLSFFEDFMAIYLTLLMQAYALKREGRSLNPSSHSELLFREIEEEMGMVHPHSQDASFMERYAAAQRVLATQVARRSIGFSLAEKIRAKRVVETALETPR